MDRAALRTAQTNLKHDTDQLKYISCTHTNTVKTLSTNDMTFTKESGVMHVFWFWDALPWKMKVIHSILSSSDVGRKLRLLCSFLHANTEHQDCLRDIVDVTSARARRKWRTVYPLRAETIAMKGCQSTPCQSARPSEMWCHTVVSVKRQA